MHAGDELHAARVVVVDEQAGRVVQGVLGGKFVQAFAREVREVLDVVGVEAQFREHVREDHGHSGQTLAADLVVVARIIEEHHGRALAAEHLVVVSGVRDRHHVGVGQGVFHGLAVVLVDALVQGLGVGVGRAERKRREEHREKQREPGSGQSHGCLLAGWLRPAGRCGCASTSMRPRGSPHPRERPQ